MRFLKTTFIFLLTLAPNKSLRTSSSSEASSEEDSGNSNSTAYKTLSRSLHRLLPSRPALEEVGVSFLDALIKAGQIQLAKGAFHTQLETLKKLHPEQYEKYEDIPLDQLAADAVIQQSEAAKRHPGSGNRLIDMFNENGIPVGSSLKSIQQAITVQKQIESSDPMEQVGKAVFEKFQKEILPGLVANIIAGKNPLQMFGQKGKMTPFETNTQEEQHSASQKDKSYEEN